MKTFALIARIVIAYAAISIGCFLMLRIIAGYTAFHDDVQFLAVKQAYVHNPVWKMAFYIHVFSAVIALGAGFTQFSDEFFRRHRRLHRWIGYIYVVDIFLINVPAGFVLALAANGLLPGRTAFVVLDSLWFLFTARAFLRARRRKFATHREDMIRSFALTFSAVTLRSWHLILSHLSSIDPLHLYMIDAWLGFLPNLLVAEGIIRLSRKTSVRRRIADDAAQPEHASREDDDQSHQRQ